METPASPEQIVFFLRALLNYILSTRVSYDRAFKTIIDKYRFSRSTSAYLYKIGYYAVNYYYSIRWLSSKHGYGVKPSGVVSYLSSLGFSIRRLLSALSSHLEGLSTAKRLSILYGYPEFLARDLAKHIDTSEIEMTFASLNRRKRWLRVNLLKASVEGALKCLDEAGVEYERSFISYVYRVKRPLWTSIARNKCISEGLVVPQDISSALSIEVVKDYVEGSVLDACSAPGLKLSLLYMLTGNKPFSLAVDYSKRRILVEGELLHKLGVNGSRVVLVSGDSSTATFGRTFSLAIVDAPCSGLGAVYSDPAVKLNSSSKSKLEYYGERQYSILRNVLKQAERVLYISCSIHPSEGEAVIERVVREGLAEPVKIGGERSRLLSSGYSGYEVSSKTYRIKPHSINGQGFFLALLESRAVGK